MYTVYHLYVQHQQQVAAAVERAKQVTMQELNAIIGVINYSYYWQRGVVVNTLVMINEVTLRWAQLVLG